MSLYIFDKDGTLVQYVRSRFLVRHTPLKCEYQILCPGVFEKIAKLRAEGHKIAVATNQTSVTNGLITLQQAEALVENCAAKIGGVSAWRLSPYNSKANKKLNGEPNPYARDDEMRKPHPGMIFQLMEELETSPAETFVVGNSKDDKKCAKAAGVEYLKADKFFKFD